MTQRAPRGRDSDRQAMLAHFALPAGPHSWHLLHLVAQKLYYLPLLFAAARLGLAGTLTTAALVSALFLGHVFVDWTGSAMVQADQVAEVFTFWLTAIVTSALFGRERSALEEARRAHEETLRALAGSLELRERYTAGHSERVREYSLLIARKLDLAPLVLANVAAGALLHDIGKIGIADSVLLKDTPLDEQEWVEMRRHPTFGASLVGSIRSLAEVRELVLAHHERFDGKGYPRGLAGQDIPFGARIFAVADTFDAVTTNRPYRKGRSFEEARQILAYGRGGPFDPVVADAFLELPFEVVADAAAHHGVQLRRTRDVNPSTNVVEAPSATLRGSSIGI